MSTETRLEKAAKALCDRLDGAHDNSYLSPEHVELLSALEKCGEGCDYHVEARTKKPQRGYEITDVQEILLHYLKSNGYDGLYNIDTDPGYGCSCLLPSIAPCACLSLSCRPGYRTECDCGEGCDYHVEAKK